MSGPIREGAHPRPRLTERAGLPCLFESHISYKRGAEAPPLPRSQYQSPKKSSVFRICLAASVESILESKSSQLQPNGTT